MKSLGGLPPDRLDFHRIILTDEIDEENLSGGAVSHHPKELNHVCQRLAISTNENSSCSARQDARSFIARYDSQ